MTKIQTMEQGKAVILGGAVLGGGGGGSVFEAQKALAWALQRNSIEILLAQEVDSKTMIATVALVGPPSTKHLYPEPEAFILAFELLREQFPVPLEGIISNENGGYASINGFCQSAHLNIPILDIPCNGRAHPLGLMGAMGLHNNPDYTSYQAGVSLKEERQNHFFFQGDLITGSSLVVHLAAELEAMVAVARNPVQVQYAKKHGAPGALEQAYTLGQFLNPYINQGGGTMARQTANFFPGTFLGEGRIEKVMCQQTGGLDIGMLEVADLNLTITFCNEFIQAQRGEATVASFPDLIVLFDGQSGWPLAASELAAHQEVAVVTVGKEQLLLGAGMKDRSLMKKMQGLMNTVIEDFM